MVRSSNAAASAHENRPIVPVMVVLTLSLSKGPGLRFMHLRLVRFCAYCIRNPNGDK